MASTIQQQSFYPLLQYKNSSTQQHTCLQCMRSTWKSKQRVSHIATNQFFGASQFFGSIGPKVKSDARARARE